MSGFVHLRLHSEYSLVDSIIRVTPFKKKGEIKPYLQPLTEHAAALGMPAIALTDQCNLFAMVKFYKAAEAAGIKPITGADVWLAPREAEAPPERVTLLAIDHPGYLNLVQLVSRSFREGQALGRPIIERAWLAELNAGLIALSGRQGEIGRELLAGHVPEAEAALSEWRGWFGDRFYLELQRCNRPDDEAHVQAAVALARIHGVPVVASNDVRFLRREDFEAHEARVCINQGYTIADARRVRDTSEEQYLKSAEEMQALFADLPEAVANTVEIAQRCSLQLSFGTNYLPDFPVPEGRSVAEHLAERSREGLERRLAQIELAAPREAYAERLAYELGVIESMEFPGYFLIVADFIEWAKQHDVPVGPGRGSGAGSLVAYAIGITDIDPLAFDLLFERFLNPERVSMPDFDIDFCMEGRDKVIDYVADAYGRDHVGQIITYGSMAARAVVRDVTRVMGQPFGVGDRIAKMIPGAPSYKGEAKDNGCTELEYALTDIPELGTAYRDEEDIREIIDMALKLEGLARQVGKHAGGVVIAPRPLTDFVPLFCEPGGGGLVTQFDMKDLESVGLVKFDFLGLRTLTIINWAVKTVNQRHALDTPLEILDIPIDDPDTFRTFASGRLLAVFQMESAGMQKLAKDMQPDRLSDIVALVALYRPGPMDLIPDYIARKHGQAKAEYLHPELEPILSETHGIMVYQEQVMQIAQQLAGYSLGAADLLRRAMGKKIAEEMAKQRQIFVDGAQGRGIEADTAGAIFDLMEKFASYGFNKSHSAAYALVAYQTCWLKTHYPAEFMCAVLSAEMFRTETVVVMIAECEGMGIAVAPPDVNRSHFRFTVGSDTEIVYGLGAIKGAGEGAIESIIAEREANGAYSDLFEFCRRIDTRKANKRVIEALINAGALDAMQWNRATLMDALPKAMMAAEQDAASAERGQEDLFGGVSEIVTEGVNQTVEPQAPWHDLERLRREKATLGLYLSGHPVETYRSLIDQVCNGSLATLAEACPAPVSREAGEGRRRRRRGPQVMAAGWLVDIRRFGRRAVLTIDDRTALFSVPLNEEQWEAQRELLKIDTMLFINGNVGFDDFSGRHEIRPQELLSVDAVYHRFVERVLLRLNGNGTAAVRSLKDCLGEMRREGGCPVLVEYSNGDALARLKLGRDWRIHLNAARAEALSRCVGERNLRLRFRAALELDDEL